MSLGDLKWNWRVVWTESSSSVLSDGKLVPLRFSGPEILNWPTRWVSGEDWRWSSTDLRKQRRPRPFTNSPEIRSCLNLVSLRIDPRLPLFPLPKLYLDGTATAGEALSIDGTQRNGSAWSLLPSHAGLSSGPWNGFQRISVLTVTPKSKISFFFLN